MRVLFYYRGIESLGVEYLMSYHPDGDGSFVGLERFVGRVGARTPVYGPLNTVLPSEVAEEWLKKLLDQASSLPMEQLAVMQLARRTDDRYRDVSDKLRAKTLTWLRSQSAPAHFFELVEHTGHLDAEEQGMVFGEALPKGLRIE